LITKQDHSCKITFKILLTITAVIPFQIEGEAINKDKEEATEAAGEEEETLQIKVKEVYK
jgi:hypothetical protein